MFGVAYAGGEKEATRAGKGYTIANVVSIEGLSWYANQEIGMKAWAEETGNKAYMLGPSKADAALQIPIIEDQIAQGVDGLVVTSVYPEALEPVLKKARDLGIAVITNEAAGLKNVDYDIEAFDNIAYGAHLMDHLARFMGEEGEYACFVASLNLKSHNEWIDGAIARQKQKYPKMKLVTDRIEAFNDQTVAYERVKELLKAYPNLKGTLSCSVTTAAGAGLAVEEKGLQDQVMVVGTSIVSTSGQYLESGAVKLISCWYPHDMGIVCNKLCVMVIEGKSINSGDDLGLPGYENVTVKGNVIYGAAWIDITKENMDKYDF
jgi:simple sugar transport system substrate-binding protein